MTIDYVHDLQNVYRNILHSMTRPGAVSSFEKAAENMDDGLPCYQGTFLIALTLFDAETSFCIVSDHHQHELSEKIAEYTLASCVAADSADYVIVLSDAAEEKILRAMGQCKNGTLVNPEHSSTWIMENKIMTSGSNMVLTGPGIHETSRIRVNVSPEVWKARYRRTEEYPLGIDLIFIDEASRMICIPRTTAVDMTGVG